MSEPEVSIWVVATLTMPEAAETKGQGASATDGAQSGLAYTMEIDQT